MLTDVQEDKGMDKDTRAHRVTIFFFFFFFFLTFFFFLVLFSYSSPLPTLPLIKNDEAERGEKDEAQDEGDCTSSELSEPQRRQGQRYMEENDIVDHVLHGFS